MAYKPIGVRGKGLSKNNRIWLVVDQRSCMFQTCAVWLLPGLNIGLDAQLGE